MKANRIPPPDQCHLCTAVRWGYRVPVHVARNPLGRAQGLYCARCGRNFRESDPHGLVVIGAGVFG